MSKKSFQEEFEDAVLNAKKIGKPAENLPSFSDKPNIISRHFNDPRNHWRDFLLVEKAHPEAIPFSKGTSGSAGYDIFPFADGFIEPWSKAVVNTRIIIGMPPGVYGQIASRSGLAFKNGIIAFPGIIDQDYRGEINVLLFNNTNDPFQYNRTQAIAQLLLVKYEERTDVKVVTSIQDILGKTARGIGGFGSTDKK